MTYERRQRFGLSATLAIMLTVSCAGHPPAVSPGQAARTDAAVMKSIVIAFADSLGARLKVEPRPVRPDADGIDLEHVLEGSSDTVSSAERQGVLRALRIDVVDFRRATDCAGALAPDPAGRLHAGCPRVTEVWLALSLPSRRRPSASLQDSVESGTLSDSALRTVRVLALTRTSRGSVLDVFDFVVRRGARNWEVRERRHLLTVD